MGLFYSFVSPDAQQLERRRQLLDRYGQIAQLSALVPLLLIYISFFLRYLLNRYAISFFGRGQKAHQSPRVSTFRAPTAGSWKVKWRRFNWALDDEVLRGWDGWGTRREWAFAGGWTLWLLLLVFKDTTNGVYSSHYFRLLFLFFSLLKASRPMICRVYVPSLPLSVGNECSISKAVRRSSSEETVWYLDMAIQAPIFPRMATFAIQNTLSLSRVITNDDLCRLSSPHETLWHRCCLSTATSLPPSRKVLVPNPASDPHVP